MALQAVPKEKERGFRRPFAGNGRWGPLEYLILVAGLITMAATMYLFQNYDQILIIWRAEEQAEQTVEEIITGDQGDPGPIEIPWTDHVIQITKVQSAVDSGAVCLDGSPPAYYLDRGQDEGADKWLIHLEGGGWCRTAVECLFRAFTQLGSSRYMADEIYFGGILSSSPKVNPDFYNWNRVRIKYCDGGSFFGDVAEPVTMTQSLGNHHSERTTPIYYRGMRIWKAVMDDLLSKGMASAKMGFLTGCSAGGLAASLQCDNFKELMPGKATVKCLSDAGFFLHMPDVKGQKTIELFYKDVVTLQNIAPRLPEACTSARDPAHCFFPTYRMSVIKTPFFMLNPAYDTWQFFNVLIPLSTDPSNEWEACKSNISLCTDTQLKTVQGFRTELLKQLQGHLTSPNGGAFLNSCYTHCQTEQDWSWSGDDGPKIDGKSISQVVGEWYNDDKAHIAVDCPFPCNPTCV